MGRYWIFIVVVFLLGCARSTSRYLYESSNLKIEKIGAHTYHHISYLNHKGNQVGCTGLFSIFGDDAVIIDSPTNEAATNELLDYIFESFHPNRTRAVPNHFHVDCTAGLQTMLDRGVFVYAYAETIKLIENQELASELKPFNQNLDLELGNGDGLILNRYFGPAHTRDNIASYILPDSILFGGCMVKSLNAGKGNLADADTLQWSRTIKNMKNDIFGKAKIVVPGHGTPGGMELLDYTIQMFENKK